MTFSLGHQLLKVESLLGSYSNLLVDAQIGFCVHHRAVEPVDLAEPSNAAEDANVRTIDFGNDLGDFVFRKSERIGRAGRLFVHSHFAVTPQPQRAAEVGIYSVSHSAHKLNRTISSPQKDGRHPQIESKFSSGLGTRRGTQRYRRFATCTRQATYNSATNGTSSNSQYIGVLA